jgi:hypothetical protein
MALPTDILLGVYLGLLTGILPALVAWGLGFVFRYVTGVTVPGLAVVALGVAIAGVNGGLLGLTDQVISRSPTLVTALLVVLMMTLYAHSRGDRMGAAMPRRVSLGRFGARTLSADVVELVEGRNQVRVTVDGEVADLEGYPPLSAALRTTLSAGEWRFPADLTLRELEDRLAERLRAEHDLAAVEARVDERGRATLAAAPPQGSLSKRVPDGKRAVSVTALVPTGVARRDEVELTTPAGTVTGTVLSARSDRPAGATDGGVPPVDDVASVDPPAAPTTGGGDGRVTVAVDREAVADLLGVDRARLAVTSRGTRREYELLSLLRSAGDRLRRVTVVADGPLDGEALGAVDLREEYGVVALAARTAGADDRPEWRFAPPGRTELAAGDELFVVGRREAVAAFAEVAA